MLIDLHSVPLLLNMAIFAVAAILIWNAGTRLSRYADVISHRTALQRAFAGLVLLAFATSLPEIATTVTAAAIDRPGLAVNNLLGGIVLQTVILALADAVAGGSPLTRQATRAVALFQAASLIVLLSLALAGTIIGEIILPFNVGLWSSTLFVAYLVTLFLEHRQQERDTWRPDDQSDMREGESSPGGQNEREQSEHSTRTVFGLFAVGALVILVAGTTLARTADALAVQTGLGTGFIGATLLATATSLPEVSTTIGAVRIGAYNMAISNVFGSNMLMVAFLFLTDVFYTEGVVLNRAGLTEQFAMSMGIAVTAIYLIGLIQRRDRTVLRMGFDSVAVIFVYVLTLAGFYFLR